MSEVAQHTATIDSPPSAVFGETERVWVMRRHQRLTLQQAHAVIEVDWEAGVARTSCGLGLTPDAVTDVPMGGCQPCVVCVATTPAPASL